MRIKYRAAARRGVLLLLILGLLAMFGLVAIAFLVITGQAEQTAEINRRLGQYVDDPEEDLTQAMMQVARGSQNAASVLGPHSLFEDIYGTHRQFEFAAASVKTAGAGPGNVLLEMKQAHLRVGHSLVMLDGTAVGQRRTIIGYVVDPNTDPYTVSAVLKIKEFGQEFTNDPVDPHYPATNDPYMVAGAPLLGAMRIVPIVDLDPGYPNHDVLLRPFVGPNPVGQLIAFTPLLPPPDRPTNATNNESFLLPNARQYVGCVLTMLEGPAAGRSTRIVGYNDKGTSTFNDDELQIAAFEGVPSQSIGQAVTASPDGLDYMINGTPFSGTGFGYDLVGEDRNRNGTLDPGEDFDDDGVIDGPLEPPLLSALDPGEDRNSNGKLDGDEDWNGDGVIDRGWPYALAPNPAAFVPDNLTGYIDPAGPGGANEDYDAPDYQNMLLAMQLPDGSVPIPSLHRPALVNYWMKQVGGEAEWKQNINNLPLRRRVMLRPLGGVPRVGAPQVGDHEDFDGGGNGPFNPSSGEPDHNPKLPVRVPGFNPAWDGSFVDNYDSSGNPNPDGVCDFTWDVDNDGDGITDSIWVDLGLPVRSMPDGRRYKPLFAIHCVDLDGRLNLNAHGCLTQLLAEYDNPLPSPNYGLSYAGQPSSVDLPRGQGYGPAEINLGALFPSPAQYRNLLLGNWMLDGRYGEADRRAPSGDPDYHFPAPGLSTGPANDLLSYNKLFDFPSNYYRSLNDNSPTLTAYGTPGDLKGSLAVGLDLRGQPVYRVLRGVPLSTDPTGTVDAWDAQTWAAAGSNDPYELDLSLNVARDVATPARIDNPFTPAELERVLRPYDVDAPSLPSRLVELAPDLAPQPSAPEHLRHQVTTESWDLPCPNVAMTPGLRDDFSGIQARHVIQLLEAAGVVNPVEQAKMLPPELLAGLRMDLDRPFGDGEDSDSNGVVDEPGEAVSERLTLRNAAGDSVSLDFDANNDGFRDFKDENARHLYARHLYVLMMLLVRGEDWYPPWLDSTAPGFIPSEERARAIAQWAVNVVDFRDRDAIMTPFEYDRDPFNGWNVDGDLATDDGLPNDPHVVWGCERPELLITETLAFYDRRTQDWDAEGGTVEDGHDASGDFDQKYKPEWSVFFELFNPWSKDEARPGEFYYDRGTAQWSDGVLLDQQTPGGDPVWRLAIANPNDEFNYVDLDSDPKILKDPEDQKIDRSVYFAGAASDGFAGGGLSFYPDAANPRPAPIRNNHYAVIGPGDPGETAASRTTYVGYRNDPPLGDDSTRRIVLTPGLDADTPDQVAVFGDGTTNDLTSLGGAIRNPVAVVVDQPRRLNLSGREVYPTENPPGIPYSDANGYTDIFVNPLDKNEPDWDFLSVDGTTPRFRIVHLQRLADPLDEWDPATNPYRVIDSMQIDLTAFNGVNTKYALDDPDVIHGFKDRFNTRERGETAAFNRIPNNLWRAEQPQSPKIPQDRPPPVPNQMTMPKHGPSPRPAGHYFSQELGHTLGYLNEPFGNPRSGPAEYRGDPPDTNDPQDGPFPWLTWNNRPFVSQMELLLVPAMQSSQLLVNFGVGRARPNAYDPSSLDYAPFPHMLNFFRVEGVADASLPVGGNTSPPGHFYRLLEYVHVPSRFVGTETQGNPEKFGAGSGQHSFHPPFHGISRYREPGRINLNTIFSREVWDGLMNGFPVTGGIENFWQDRFIRSRRGFGNASDTMWEMVDKDAGGDTDYPTRFANPFRSFAGRDLVPPVSNRTGTENNVLGDGIQDGIHATLLRANPNSLHGSGTNRKVPLFAYEPTTQRSFNDTSRSPHFRYQALQRLGNLVTTRSNVYAVWITVGYFEAVKPPPDVPKAEVPTIYPDGFALGAEMGTDTGEIRRHRGFFIIDRSIPVGFQRGKDLNVERALLVKRFIE